MNLTRAFVGSLLFIGLVACGGGSEGGGNTRPPPTVTPPPEPEPQPIVPQAPTIPTVQYGERPVLYVLVDFNDWQTELDDETHFERMYYDNYGVFDYYRRLFKGRVQITAAAETYGTPNDGIIRVRTDQNHPNDPIDKESMVDVLISLSENIDEYVDATSFDADGNGYLTPDELSIAFVVAGKSPCKRGCLQNDLPDVRGFAILRGTDAESGDVIILDGVVAPHFGVQPERGLLGVGGYVDSFAITTLIHEVGHFVFGVSDHYGEYEDQDDSVSYLNDWCLFSGGAQRRPSDGALGPQIMGGYTRLETNLIKAQKVNESAVIGLDSAATSTIDDARIDSSLARIWLDPYEVRESLVFEYRDNKGYDSFLGGSGALITRTHSLANSGNSAPEDYRRAKLLSGGSGYDGSVGIGQTAELTARTDTPGYTEDPVYAARTASLQYDGVSNDRAFFNTSIDEYGPPRGHLRYDNSPGDETNVHTRTGRFGYEATTKAYAGTIYVNTTDFDTVDGMEVPVQGDSTITIEIYADILDDGTPFDLLSSETFSVEGDGWQRVFFENPLEFEPGSSRFIVVGIENNTPEQSQFILPVSKVTDRDTYEVQSYISNDGLKFSDFNDGRFRKVLLMSKQQS